MGEARRHSGAYRFFEYVLRPIVAAYTKPTWQGVENLPEGGFIAVSNHVTNIDALTFGHFLVANGVPVKFLAKQEMFDLPVIGRLFAKADQIPVQRNTATARQALVAAEAALKRGECIGIFPEGTLTRDPDMWPMAAKTGAARLALTTGVPVIPIAQWGTETAINRYSKVPKPRLRVPVTVRALPPVDLDDLRALEYTPEVAKEATRRIMADLTAGVAAIRGEEPPARVYDIRVDGDPRPKKKKRQS
ncbi:MAG: lysophospholipid acyltransferase family protein [Bowdeniella nasicola]|nr:lysophospholipid acyltransferase family protein [Bowdeniella nasicola]